MPITGDSLERLLIAFFAESWLPIRHGGWDCGIFDPAMPEFVFATCQFGAEAALKDEIARDVPALRFAYSRPGFLTFKLLDEFPASASASERNAGRGNKSRTSAFIGSFFDGLCPRERRCR